jgi:hypothetical protein
MPGKRARPVRREAARKRTCPAGTSPRGRPIPDRQKRSRTRSLPGPPLHPWYRHITLAMLAAAYLAVTRDQEEKKGDTHPPTS